MAKWKKAPKWFLDIEKELDEIDSKLDEICNVEKGWFKERRLRREIKLAKFALENALKNSNAIEKRRVMTILEYGDRLAAYRWAKFKYENLDNEFGIADCLEFNPKNGRIYIKKSIFRKVKELLEKAKAILAG